MHTNNIYLVFSIDRNYIQHCIATIQSILDNYSGNLKVVIFIVHQDLNANDKDIFFNQLSQNPKFNIEFIHISNSVLNELPIGQNTISNDITISTYFRIFLPNLLNAEIKKIIYLDSDIIVNESIDKLWNYDITNYAIAAVRDKETLQEQNKKRLGIEDQYSYINAGIEIINLDFLREIDFVNKSLEFVKKHRNKILYHDQDIINALLYKKIFYLPYCWNMMDCYLYKFPQCNPNYTSDIIQYQKNPSIIHFAGRYKPWHKECRNPYRNLYWRYLKKTGIKYFPTLRKETSLKRIIKIFFKRLLKDNPYIKLGENNV